MRYRPEKYDESSSIERLLDEYATQTRTDWLTVGLWMAGAAFSFGCFIGIVFMLFVIGVFG